MITQVIGKKQKTHEGIRMNVQVIYLFNIYKLAQIHTHCRIRNSLINLQMNSNAYCLVLRPSIIQCSSTFESTIQYTQYNTI